jgi:hypothetical protein
MDSGILRRTKPGWLSRVFGIETGSLIACDATWDGSKWTRGDGFQFLFRGYLGHFFLLSDELSWKELSPGDAVQRFAALPVKLVSEEQAFREGSAESLGAT